MLTLFLVFLPLFSWAESSGNQDQPRPDSQQLEPIVVSASRHDEKSISTPVGRKELQEADWEQKGETVESGLSSIPGLSYSNTGGIGQPRSIFIRGARAEDTLVILDGIPLNDPLSPTRSFDFSQMPSSLESIEILKGAQSVLYGSDALGGVVLLKSKEQTEPQAKIEAGSYGTYKARASHLGFRANYGRSDGISSADERLGNTERDGYRTYSFGGKKSFALGPNGLLEAQGFYQYQWVETDRDGGPGGDSLGTQTKSRNLTFRLAETHDLGQGFSLHSGVSHFSRNRDDNTVGPAFYRSQTWRAESILRKSFQWHSATAGLDFHRDSGTSSDFLEKKFLHIFSGFLQWDWSHKKFSGSQGARIDLPSQHQKEVTYRSALGYWILEDELQARASIGSGLKVPSLYQTYSRYGSANLKPSSSLSKDVSLQYKTSSSETELTLFENRFKNSIDFVSTPSPGRYQNIGRADSVGLEFAHRQDFFPLYFDNALTYMNARDRTNGERLRRRPRLSLASELGVRRGDFAGASLQMRWIKGRTDTLPIFPYTAQAMPSFAVFRLEGFHRIRNLWKLSLRIENLFDRSYQETSGFGTPERSFYVGLDWN